MSIDQSKGKYLSCIPNSCKEFWLTFIDSKRRVLSNPRDLSEYPVGFPQEMASMIKTIDGIVEFSEIHSEKLYDLWIKFAKKMKPELPRVTSPEAKDQNLIDRPSASKCGDTTPNIISNCARIKWKRKEISLSKLNSKNMISIIQESIKKSKRRRVISSFNMSNDDVQEMHDFVKEKIRAKLESHKKNRMHLFTFNPEVMRAKSPIVFSRARRLIEENGFNQIYQSNRKSNL